MAKKYFIKLFSGIMLVTLALLIAAVCPSYAQEKSSKPASAVEPVRGVWITVTDSRVLYSRQNIASAMDKLKSQGINNAFVVVWRQGRTLYPSAVMKKLTGISIQEDMAGRDPLKECIEEGHKRGIKVHAWFEFGFASSYQDNGGILLKLNSQWACIGVDGKPVVKNGFYWMNGLHPEVQALMTSLFEEVITNYDVDGVQGDDRLPAMPVEGGYDTYTSTLYEKENGKKPPADFREAEWVQWRSDKLTIYMDELASKLRKMKPGIIVSSSPSIYPWSRDEYLQDWICWVERGYVDYACPQMYRKNFDDYKKEMDYMLDEALSVPYHDRIFPGILLKVGKYKATAELIDSMIKENRRRGIEGEVYFFYEGLE